jgi:hypothetical protein
MIVRTTRALLVGLAVAALAPPALAESAPQRSDAPRPDAGLAQVPAAFAGGRYDAAAADLLATLEARYAALPPAGRAALAGFLAIAYAENRRVADAHRLVGEIGSPQNRRYALVAVVLALAHGGAQADARSLLAEIGDPRAGGPEMAVALAEAAALVGEVPAAVALARSLATAPRVAALARIAAVGATGRPDGATEQAFAEARNWAPPNEQSEPVVAALISLARAHARFAQYADARARLAMIPDPEIRAVGMFFVAADLGRLRQQEAARQVLRDGEQLLADPADASTRAPLEERISDVALQTLATAYACAGEAESASRALAAVLSRPGGAPELQRLVRATMVVARARACAAP